MLPAMLPIGSFQCFHKARAHTVLCLQEHILAHELGLWEGTFEPLNPAAQVGA
jgi:hypothetical protein